MDLPIPILMFRPDKDSFETMSAVHCSTCPIIAFCKYQEAEAEINLRDSPPNAEFFEVEGDIEKMKYAVENCPLRKLLEMI